MSDAAEKWVPGVGGAEGSGLVRIVWDYEGAHGESNPMTAAEAEIEMQRMREEQPERQVRTEPVAGEEKAA